MSPFVHVFIHFYILFVFFDGHQLKVRGAGERKRAFQLMGLKFYIIQLIQLHFLNFDAGYSKVFNSSFTPGAVGKQTS